MTPDEIIEAYNVVVQDLRNESAREAARIGNAQASLGTMAERVARPSGMTSGLANYTYNRTMRPTIEQSAASLTTAGLANALDNNLQTELRAAKNRYENAKNSYTASSGGSSSSGGSGDNGFGWTESIGKEGTGEMKNSKPDTTLDGMTAGWGELSDWWSGEYNFSLPNNIEVELGGWDEELKKGGDGNYYIWNKKNDTYTKITGKQGNTVGGGRWWTK